MRRELMQQVVARLAARPRAAAPPRDAECGSDYSEVAIADAGQAPARRDWQPPASRRAATGGVGVRRRLSRAGRRHPPDGVQRLPARRDRRRRQPRRCANCSTSSDAAGVALSRGAARRVRRISPGRQRGGDRGAGHRRARAAPVSCCCRALRSGGSITTTDSGVTSSERYRCVWRDARCAIYDLRAERAAVHAHEADRRREQRHREQAPQRRQCAHGAQLARGPRAARRRRVFPRADSRATPASTTAARRPGRTPASIAPISIACCSAHGFGRRAALICDAQDGRSKRATLHGATRGRTARPVARRGSADQHLRSSVVRDAQGSVPPKGVRRPRSRLHAAVAHRGSGAARLEGHDAYFTVGQRIGTLRLHYPHGRHPLAADAASRLCLDTCRIDPRRRPSDRFTTVASWRGAYAPVTHEGETFRVEGARVPQDYGPAAALAAPVRSRARHPSGDVKDLTALHAHRMARRESATRRGHARGLLPLHRRIAGRVLGRARHVRADEEAAGSAIARRSTWPPASRPSCRTPDSAAPRAPVRDWSYSTRWQKPRAVPSESPATIARTARRPAAIAERYFNSDTELASHHGRRRDRVSR